MRVVLCVDQECDLVSGLNNSTVRPYNKTSVLLKGSEQLPPLVAAVKSCAAACVQASDAADLLSHLPGL